MLKLKRKKESVKMVELENIVNTLNDLNSRLKIISDSL